MKRALIIVGLVALIGGGVTVGVIVSRPGAEAPRDRIVLFGQIEIRDARLAFAERELVASVDVEEGDVVEPGDVLARLRTGRLDAELAGASASRDAQREVVRRLENGTREQELAQARAEVGAAEVRVENARRDFDRLRRTAETGASSARDLDSARAAFDVAEAELVVKREALALAVEGPREEDLAQARATLAALESRVTLLELRLRDTTLVSPTRGVVQSRILEPGESADPGRPVVTLALTDRKWARVYVAEPDLGRVAHGQEAAVRSDSWPDRTFSGHVGFISPTAEFTPKSVETTDLRTRLVYEMRVRVEDPDDTLRLGMPVTVEILVPAALSAERTSSPESRG